MDTGVPSNIIDDANGLCSSVVHCYRIDLYLIFIMNTGIPCHIRRICNHRWCQCVDTEPGFRRTDAVRHYPYAHVDVAHDNRVHGRGTHIRHSLGDWYSWNHCQHTLIHSVCLFLYILCVFCSILSIGVLWIIFLYLFSLCSVCLWCMAATAALGVTSIIRHVRTCRRGQRARREEGIRVFVPV